ncbi:unnamed protein product [Sphagnum jensenii]|uniref:Cysteine proteinase inhibitor n=1 Tax=Sphagnum jensenii TaxID=128206 RepID=A0ABP1BAX7_9BRYO
MLRRGETARPVCAAACILLVLLLLDHGAGADAMLGGIKEVGNVSNSLEMDELAKFAVDEHNSRGNSLDKLSFSKVVSARTQVVQGTMYHLTIEVQEGGNPRLYDAKVWVKPWENFKKLEEFKPAVTPSTFTSADLGTRTGIPLTNMRNCGPSPGFQTVPTNDPNVKEAAEHALKKLQQSSNSLTAYELSEIVSAQAEVKEEDVVFDLLLKTKRGATEEHFKAEVQRTVDGTWSLKHIKAQ